jgi:hypothetical protein
MGCGVFKQKSWRGGEYRNILGHVREEGLLELGRRLALTSYIVLDALMEQRNDDVRELQRRRKRGR